jgi:hypothetical protein
VSGKNKARAGTKTKAKAKPKSQAKPKPKTKSQKTGSKVSRTATPVRRQASVARPMPPPFPVRHVAAPRPAVVAPARSMPPLLEGRKAVEIPPPFVVPIQEFGEAGVILAITYSIREGRRAEFYELMKELKPLLSAIGGTDCTVYEDRSRASYFMEVFRFKDEAEFTAFDDKFHKDRKIAAIYSLLDDIVEAEKSDFKIFERRL